LSYLINDLEAFILLLFEFAIVRDFDFFPRLFLVFSFDCVLFLLSTEVDISETDGVSYKISISEGSLSITIEYSRAGFSLTHFGQYQFPSGILFKPKQALYMNIIIIINFKNFSEKMVLSHYFFFFLKKKKKKKKNLLIVFIYKKLTCVIWCITYIT